MIELHLVGYTAELGHLVLDLAGAEGGRYRLVVDADLFATIDELREQRRAADLPVGDLVEFADDLGLALDHLRRIEDEQASTAAAAGRVSAGSSLASDALSARQDSEPPDATVPEGWDEGEPDAPDALDAADAPVEGSEPEEPERPAGDQPRRPWDFDEGADSDGASLPAMDTDTDAPRPNDDEDGDAGTVRVVRPPAPDASNGQGSPRWGEQEGLVARLLDEQAALDLDAADRDDDDGDDDDVGTDRDDDVGGRAAPAAHQVPPAAPDRPAVPEPPEPQGRTPPRPLAPEGPPPRRDGASAPPRPGTPAAPSPRPEPTLSPAQIQGRLRSGDSVRSVARAAGVDPEWIRRWEAPIVAERARVLDQARSMRLERARLGRSAHPLGDAVARNLRAKGVRTDDIAWEVSRRRDGRWRVAVRYVSRGRKRSATWTYDPDADELRAASDNARDVGFTRRRR